ncbi:response regulator transcription factor [Micromonospora sp. WMMD1128]|uniref:response regulator transcription factor n=1 Tax=unclassified Micromonospora TaxID=2617518 RepID=UPI00248B633A|nr:MULTISPECIES: response regulator transcription factor [unclassified Micromonospora]WBB76689.1 response regulator transcription factor [Micromonospora sp. WMMD1128]WFE35523.1 response regulator transcription factor [Micromonospora sp. WMMD975]
MVRTLLAIEGRLVRGALAHLLATQEDIDVVAEADTADTVHDALLDVRPDVAVIDVDVVPVERLVCLAAAADGNHGGRLLVLVDRRRAGRLRAVLAAHRGRIGFLDRDVPPARIAEGVRQVADGQVVLDPDLVVAALEVADNPLTPREREVLDVAAAGVPVREIADKLGVSPGTVRNHLSHVMAKTGARTRLEAVRIARESCWI